LDIAFLEVPPVVADQQPVRFFVLDSEAVTPTVGTPVLSKGYPTDCALPMGGGDKLLLPAVNSARITQHAQPESLDAFDEAESFLVPYHLAPEFHARGFSGAPAWFQKATGQVWHSNPGLAGVCTNYYQGSGLLSFVKIERIINLLRQRLSR